jgi:hypothetical protein
LIDRWGIRYYEINVVKVEKLQQKESFMKKLTAGVLVALMVVMGAALATAADLPQALKGVNLSTAQALTPDQAQQVRGTAPPSGPPQVFI